MSDQTKQAPHSVKKEPKFCRCRVCHAHFYGNTIAEAREDCQEHGRNEHPDLGCHGLLLSRLRPSSLLRRAAR